VFSCDYNGWADVPEEEREGIEAFEAAQSIRTTPLWVLVTAASLTQMPEDFGRRAA
jgi:hypothetical protein